MSAAIARAARPEDLDGILAVDESFRADGTPEWSLMGRHVFETLIAAGMVHVSVLEDAVIGYLAWSILWGFAFIDYIRMRAEHRSCGLGSDLLHAMEVDVRGRGFPMVWSSTQDARALRWHERNGFQRVGTTQWIWGNLPETWLMKPV